MNTDKTNAQQGAAMGREADQFGICMLVAEAAWKAATGSDRAVRSDALREVVRDTLESLAPRAEAVEDAAARGYDDARQRVHEQFHGAPAPAVDALPAEGAYIVRFDDASREDVTFAGYGARDGALAYFEQVSWNWNAHLFVKVRSNSRDCTIPDAPANAAPKAAPAVEAMREALELARPYVESSTTRLYDGTGGHGMRQEAKRRLALIDTALANAAPPRRDEGAFQRGVERWMDACFVPSLYSNMTERGDRLLEEVLELLQSKGYDRNRIATLVEYVYGRPAGDPGQEVGGVMVTLAAYCWIAGLDMHAEGMRELSRIAQPEVMAKIRAKQEAKNALHFDTPLPGNPEQTPAERLRALKTDDAILWGVAHNAGHGRRPAPRWSHVSAVTGLGSTASALLCQRFGLDPDETVGTAEEGEDDGC